jgi:hypothetical protein
LWSKPPTEALGCAANQQQYSPRNDWLSGATQTLITEDEIADGGSVLVNHPRKKKLVLFNENNFLFSSGLLDSDERVGWEREFAYAQGIAGTAFDEAETKHFSRDDIQQTKPKLVQAAIAGRLPRGIGVTRLRDAPAEWSRQNAMLGLSN